VHRWSVIEDPKNGLWRIGPPELLVAASLMPRDRAVTFGPDEEVVIPTMHDSVRVISPRHPEGNRTLGPHSKVSWAGMSPDGSWVLTGTQFGQGLKVWDARTGHLVRDLPGGGYGRGVFDPESQWLLTDVQARGTNLLRVGTWDSFHLADVGLGAFSSDGSVLALAPNLGDIVLRNTQIHDELARLAPPRPLPIAAGADPFSPDGGTLVAGCYTQRLLQVWDLRSIRSQLLEMNLDWEPPLPPPQEPESGPSSYQVEIIAGDLAAPSGAAQSK
jgi:WD40 repeat protein